MKILFLIRSLNQGGAERQLVTLCKSFLGKGHELSVGYFYAGGMFEKELSKIKVSSMHLGKKGRWDFFLFLFRLIRIARKNSPDIIYSFFGPANVFSIFVKPFLPNVKIVWGIRASNMDLSKYNWFWRVLYLIEKRLSKIANLIIANSYSGRLYAIKNGFPLNKIRVISNGINTNNFRPQAEKRKTIREEFGLNEDDKVVGIVARIDPMKDYENFLKSARIMIVNTPEIRFLCVGSGERKYEKTIRQMANYYGLKKKILWAGLREDMVDIYNGIDILCLSSAFGEGFPNVIGEAMACSVPCVATDVGDSAMVVGETGIIVPPRQPEKLADGLRRMLERIDNEKDKIRSKVRERIVDNFSDEKMAQRTESELERLL